MARRARRDRPTWSARRGLACSLVLAAIVGCGDGSGRSDSGQTTASAATPVTSIAASRGDRVVATLADARSAVDGDRYGRAVVIATSIGSGARTSIRARIANAIARRAGAAVATGDHKRARSLLLEARRFPTTVATTRARASFRSQAVRTVQRAHERGLAAARSRRMAAAARATKPLQPAKPPSSCDPNYTGACLNPDSPDYDCAGGSGNGPDYTGTVHVVGTDHFDLDRDGDGVGCEP